MTNKEIVSFEAAMPPRIPVGISDFAKLREGNYHFVDKSLFIRDLLANGSEVVLISRPRRFGKTLNLSMLYYFLTLENKESNAKLFQGLKIAEDVEFIKKHQGRYPVIFISLRNVKKNTYETMLDKIYQKVRKLYSKHQYLLDSPALDQTEKNDFSNILNRKAEVVDIESSLMNLSEYMTKHYGEKPFVLIDEYDTPLHASMLAEVPFYKECREFFALFLGEALKDNSILKMGVVTGILQLAQTSIFSDLNNIDTYSMLDNVFGEHFGFTQSEVSALFKSNNAPYDEVAVKNWYNGYHVGDFTVYNPWSILKFLKSNGVFQSYWNATGENSLIEKALLPYLFQERETFYKLINNESITIDLDLFLVLTNIGDSLKTVWTLLFFAGYLHKVEQIQAGDSLLLRVAIPNNEIKSAYYHWITYWLQTSLSNNTYLGFADAIIKNNIGLFEDSLRKFLEASVSYHDFGEKTSEKFYHVFMLGAFSQISRTHNVFSNREAGHGRFDIILEPKIKGYAGYIFEVKSSVKESQLDRDSVAALKQIKEKRYDAYFTNSDVLEVYGVGIAFFAKKVVIKSQLL